MYTAKFMKAMRKTMDVGGCLENLDLAPLSASLEEKIWSKGSTLSTDECLFK
ncbi:hypothetical protein [Enterovibrio norvegicus]|uniref:hypothetical protein n=1 Tax=Enterovibrio norvegicus TaxID=188144 RepID=UPI0032207897